MNLSLETEKRAERYRPKIGIALGSGVARSWAHIGVLRALEKYNLKPDIVVGTSGGAVVGGLYAAGQLNAIEDWVLNLNKFRFLRYLDIRLSGGSFFQGEKLAEEFERYAGAVQSEDLKTTFAAIATDLETGHEVVLKSGKLTDIVRASFAMPSIFQPVRMNERWLVDGALVNPVPVSTCYALGADLVIAVNLNGDRMGRVRLQKNYQDETGQNIGYLSMSEDSQEELKRQTGLKQFIKKIFSMDKIKKPSLFETMWATVLITQDRITRSRLAGDPPDIYLSPLIGHIDVTAFDKAEELIAAGANAVEENITEIMNMLHLFKAKFYR